MHIPTRFLWLELLLGALSIVFAGCTTTRTTGMIPQDIHLESSHSEKVFVTVQSRSTQKDGKFFNSPEFTQSFHDALIQSIVDSKLYAVGDTLESADLILEVTMLRGDVNVFGAGPFGGAAGTTSQLINKWCLKNRGTDAVICERDITTAKSNEAIIFGPTTGRSSAEAAAAENIKQGIEWLARKTKTH
jgi:hypothetical protein